MKVWIAALLVMAAALAMPAPAAASLTVFKQFNGNVGVSTDGFGSNPGASGTISASVPAGATVLGAYLYTSLYSTADLAIANGTTLNGTNVGAFTSLGTNPSAGLTAGRVDVTSIVAPVINGGPGGVYNFTVSEGNTVAQDGEALVVVYQLASLPVTTVGILDGFSASTGDTTSINFSTPLHPGDAGFQAQMMIGDGFSFDGTDPQNPGGGNQTSRITVNGTIITQNAGHCDDSVTSCVNGSLITVGGFDDPFSPFLPTIAQDHERYNLAPQIADGSTSIVVNTLNPSNDDNIFLAVFQVTGLGGVNAPPPDSSATPEPGSLLLLASGLAYGARRLRRS